MTKTLVILGCLLSALLSGCNKQAETQSFDLPRETVIVNFFSEDEVKISGELISRNQALVKLESIVNPEIRTTVILSGASKLEHHKSELAIQIKSKQSWKFIKVILLTES